MAVTWRSVSVIKMWHNTLCGTLSKLNIMPIWECIGHITQLKIKAVATVDDGSIMCCDIGAMRHRHGWFTSDVHGLSDELLLKVTNYSPERTLR